MINYGTNEKWFWDEKYEEVYFTVHDNGNPIQCRVSRKWIEDNCGNPESAEACLDAAKKNFNRITDEIRTLVFEGNICLDGSILLRGL